MPFLTEAYFSI